MKIHPINIRSVLNSDAPVLDFVLPGLTAGSVGTIVGAGGVGKTTLLMQLAMALTTNAPAVGGVFAANGEPSRVVLIAAEESADILRIRLHAINNWMGREQGETPSVPTQDCEKLVALMEQNLFLVPAAGQSVYLVKDGEPTEFLEELSKFCKGARLIIIDPLRRLHDGDENNSAAMTHIVQMLEALAKRTGAAVIAAHHMSKGAIFSGSSDSAAASRGSSALTDAVRWQINLSGMSEAEAKTFGLTGQRMSYLRLDFAKANYIAPHPTIWLKRLEGGVLTRVNLESASTAKNSNVVLRTRQGLRSEKEKIYV